MFRKTIAITIAALLLFASYAAATGQYKTIKVYLDKVGITMNGEKTGLDADAISYNGTIYVPIDAVSKALGGIVDWDSKDHAIDFNFNKTIGGAVVSSSNAAIYQYMLVEKNQVMQKFVELIAQKNYAGMRPQIERLKALEAQAGNIGDTTAEHLLSQMAFSADVIRSTLQTKKGSDYKLAVTLFMKAEADFNNYVGKLLDPDYGEK